MPFPLSDRVIYESNPLSQVICQLRFPPILKIDAQIPADFQGHIRQFYPLFSEAQPFEPLSVPQEVLRLFPAGLPVRAAKQYEFRSADGLWTVTLTKESLALACAKYSRWEEFLNNFRGPFEALVGLYDPAFFSRIGLRYANVIQRSTLELEGVPWSELLKPYIAGEMTTPLAPLLEDTTHTLVVKLENVVGKVRIYHGIAKITGSPEEVYVIDNDFYTEERVDKVHALERLVEFNKKSGHLFRWFITDRLHAAMQPRRIG